MTNTAHSLTATSSATPVLLTRENFNESFSKEHTCYASKNAEFEEADFFGDSPENRLLTLVLSTKDAWIFKKTTVLVDFLKKNHNLPQSTLKKFHFSFCECLSNAIEHGNLGLSDQKDTLITAEDYYSAYYELLQKKMAEKALADKPIFITIDLHDDVITTCIEDSGTGFDFAALTKKFSHPGKPGYHGSGLIAVHQMVQELSFEKEGRKVSFSLPCSSNGAKKISNEFLSKTEIQQAKILVVDDQKTNRMLARTFFEKEGFLDIKEAANGQEALEILEEESFDLILLDVIMPNMTGFEVCAEIKKNPARAHIPVIFATALDETKDLAQGYQLGAVDYITKPIDPNQLIIRCGVHIKNGMLMQRLREYSQRVSDELEQARTLQMGLLPQKPFIEKLEQDYNVSIRSLFRASQELSGDYWGAFPIDDTRFAVTLADFTGHGVVSALNTVRLHALFSEKTALLASPEALLTDINDHLKELLPITHFATCLYGIVDTKEKTFSFHTSGNPPFAVLSEENGVVWHSQGGIPLGLLPSKDADFSVHTIDLRDGEQLFFYSDALIEACHRPDNSRWLQEGLNTVLSSCMKSKRQDKFKLIQERFFDSAITPVDDDLTLLMIQI